MTAQEFATRLRQALSVQYPHQLAGLGDFSDILGSIGDAISSAGSAVMSGVSSLGSGIASVGSSIGSGLLDVLNSPATSKLIQTGAQVYIAKEAASAAPRQVPYTQQNAPAVAYAVNARANQIAQSMAATGVDITTPAMQSLIRDVAATGLTNGQQTLYPSLLTPSSSGSITQYLPWVAGGGLLLLGVALLGRR